MTKIVTVLFLVNIGKYFKAIPMLLNFDIVLMYVSVFSRTNLSIAGQSRNELNFCVTRVNGVAQLLLRNSRKLVFTFTLILLISSYIHFFLIYFNQFLFFL